MDGDFPWVLAGVFLLWLFNLLGGKKGPRAKRPPRPSERPQPRPSDHAASGQVDPTQSEGSQLDELLRALEQRLDPTTPPPAARPRPTAARPPLGRPASVALPSAEELEERESLESEPVIESLDGEVHRPERVARDWLRQAEERERARLAAVETRERQSHKARHAEFDRRIRAEPAAPGVPAPSGRRFTTAQIRQAFIWAEILGRPKGES